MYRGIVRPYLDLQQRLCVHRSGDEACRFRTLLEYEAHQHIHVFSIAVVIFLAFQLEISNGSVCEVLAIVFGTARHAAGF